MTCGAQSTAVNPGRDYLASKAPAEATSNGSRSTRPTARATDSSTSLDDGINCSGGGVQFQRSTNGGVTWQSPVNIPNGPVYGTLDVDTNGNVLSAEKETPFIAFVRATRRSEAKPPLLTKNAVNMGGDLGQRRNQWSGTYRHVIPGDRSLRRGHQQ